MQLSTLIGKIVSNIHALLVNTSDVWPWKYEALALECEALALECEALALALALHANALLTMHCRSNYLDACRMMHLI